MAVTYPCCLIHIIVSLIAPLLQTPPPCFNSRNKDRNKQDKLTTPTPRKLEPKPRFRAFIVILANDADKPSLSYPGLNHHLEIHSELNNPPGRHIQNPFTPIRIHHHTYLARLPIATLPRNPAYPKLSYNPTVARYPYTPCYLPNPGHDLSKSPAYIRYRLHASSFRGRAGHLGRSRQDRALFTFKHTPPSYTHTKIPYILHCCHTLPALSLAFSSTPDSLHPSFVA